MYFLLGDIVRLFFSTVCFFTRLGFVLLSSQLLLAQEYNFSHYTVKNGLAQNQCRSVLTDPYNNIWIATHEGGISKFDGQSMTNFGISNGLPSAVVSDLLQDSAQNIWIATQEGLAVFDGFTIKTLPQRVSVKQLDRSPKGKIWFLTDKTIGFLDENLDMQMLDFQLSIDILDFAAVGGDSLVVCSRVGEVYLYDGQMLKPVLWEKEPLKGALGVFKSGVDEVVIFHNQAIYGFKNNLLFLDSTLLPLAGVKPYSVLRDSKNNFWVGIKDGVVALWGKQKVVLTEKSGIAGTVLSICEDKEQGIWFASSLGLYRYRDAGFAYYTQKQGVADKYVTSLAIEQDGTVWFTTSKGLQYIAPGQEAAFPNSLPKELLSSPRPVIVDAKKNLLVGTPYGIFRRKDKKTQNFERIAFSGKDWDYLVCALPLGEDKVLFGGSVGLWLFDGKKITKYLPSITATVNSLALGASGIWIATEGEGLYFDAPDSLYHLTREQGHINNNIVNTLGIDKFGNLWAGTSGTGLFKIIGAHPKGKFVNFEHLNLLSSNVYSIIVDDSTNIWAGTDKGICRITTLQNDYLNIKNIGEQDGFRAIEVYHGAAAKHARYLWFGTVDGLTRVSSKARLVSEKPPITFLKEIKLFQESKKWGLYSKQIDRWTGIPTSGTLELPSRENYLSFSFVATSHNQADNVQYFWMLQGYDLKWNGPTQKGEAFYPNLPPGKYVFRVRSCTVSGVCDDQAVQYHFTIKSPFYLRTWFLLFILSLALAAAIYYFNIKIKYINQEKAAAKARERQRALDLKTQEEQLNRKSRQLKRTMLELDRTNTTLSQINEELTASLTYAKRILDIILYSKENFKSYFPKSFYYEMPRKVVTGDYIWVYHDEPYLYVAMVDCTTSGVSAAFLAVMADFVIKKVVSEVRHKKPSELLVLLNEKICEILQTDTQRSEYGIDMAICRFESGSNKMMFAGAKSLAHYYHNQEIHLLKGNFYSLGLEFAGVECKFEDTEVELDQYSWVFFYNAGYPNQLGGPEMKRFKSIRMKELLQKIVNLSSSEQEAILDMEFQNWRGENPQLEDVLVAGFQPFSSPILASQTS